MDRRQVRVTEGFFDQIDAQFRSERGPNGEPSSTDFIAYELPAIIERFAMGFNELPQIEPGLPAARMLIVPGILASAIVAYGLLTDDGVIDLIGISVDP